MQTTDFSGIWIPNVTPFQKNDVYQIDKPALKKLIEYLITEQKATGIVPCGTTGESNTMSHEEDEEVIRLTIGYTAGRVPVMAGAGSNNTATAIKMTKFAEKAGANAVLSVAPYYNRPDQRGMYAHFAAIAESTALPVFIYNIPGRTGRNVEQETIIALAQKYANICGVKDCANDLTQTMRLIEAKAEINHPFYVLTGEDILAYVNTALGGDGAISASAHIIGAEMVEMRQALKEKNMKKAQEIHYQIMNMFKLLFKEPNPAPIKAAYDLMGFDFGGDLRLPLVKASDKLREELKAELKKLGKI